jgi:hypothetical protein
LRPAPRAAARAARAARLYARRVKRAFITGLLSLGWTVQRHL